MCPLIARVPAVHLSTHRAPMSTNEHPYFYILYQLFLQKIRFYYQGYKLSILGHSVQNYKPQFKWHFIFRRQSLSFQFPFLCPPSLVLFGTSHNHSVALPKNPCQQFRHHTRGLFLGWCLICLPHGSPALVLHFHPPILGNLRIPQMSKHQESDHVRSTLNNL